jgi:hypothetical protein
LVAWIVGLSVSGKDVVTFSKTQSNDVSSDKLCYRQQPNLLGLVKPQLPRWVPAATHTVHRDAVFIFKVSAAK